MKNGAMSWGYPSIVGSGPNATTLHYGSSTRQMQNGIEDSFLVTATGLVNLSAKAPRRIADVENIVGKGR